MKVGCVDISSAVRDTVDLPSQQHFWYLFFDCCKGRWNFNGKILHFPFPAVRSSDTFHSYTITDSYQWEMVGNLKFWIWETINLAVSWEFGRLKSATYIDSRLHKVEVAVPIAKQTPCDCLRRTDCFRHSFFLAYLTITMRMTNRIGTEQRLNFNFSSLLFTCTFN
jgi:hypothetical protein